MGIEKLRLNEKYNFQVLRSIKMKCTSPELKHRPDGLEKEQEKIDVSDCRNTAKFVHLRTNTKMFYMGVEPWTVMKGMTIEKKEQKEESNKSEIQLFKSIMKMYNKSVKPRN